MKQLHDRVVFEPISRNDLTGQKNKRAMEILIFLVMKRSGKIKSGMVANGSTQREYIDRDDTDGPTSARDSIIITGVIEAKQVRYVMINDFPNDFVQTPDPKDEGDEIIITKIRGALVDILCEISPEIYKPCVKFDNMSREKILYVRMLKDIYGMLIASLLYYKKFQKDIKSIGFEVNPYDTCEANRIFNGEQHIVSWKFDGLKSSHVDPKVNDYVHKWLEKTYGSNDIGHVEEICGKYTSIWR